MCSTILQLGLSVTRVPAGPPLHLALGRVDVSVGAADGPVPLPAPGPLARLGALLLRRRGGALQAGAVVGERDAVPGIEEVGISL